MKKQFLITILSLLVFNGLFALEVNQSELKSAQENNTIEFINYTGPHKIINSIDEIKGIGSSLGNVVSKSVEKNTQTGNKNKYYVIHAVDETEGNLDADILFIGENATVDHIKNLRRIIAAYLSSAYGYSEKDADTLSVFITVYNAVYRSNLKAFQNKYKEIVINNLSSENCGLSVNYKDWPGKSEIVIPLYDVKNGGLSTVDTSVISDTKVVESMKEDDDKNIESRKDMVDLKEREAEDASNKAKEDQKKAVAEQKKAAEETEKTEQKKEELAQAEKTAEEKQKIADENPEDEEAQKEAEEAKEAVEEKKEELEEQEKKEAEQKQKAEDAKEESKESQKLADKKENEAQSERKEIAQDQKEVQKKEAEKAKMTAEYGIIISDESKMLSSLVKFSAETGEILKNSPVKVIRNRTIYKTSEGYIAIAGEDGANQAIKLVILDPDNMEIIKESELSVAADSVLVQDGKDYYCIISKDSANYVAKFDENLTANIISNVSVLGCSPIAIMDSGVVVTAANGKLTILKKQDLSSINNK